MFSEGLGFRVQKSQYRDCMSSDFQGEMTCTLQSPRTARALATNIEILDASVYEISSSNAVRGLRACRRFILGFSWLAYSSYCEGRKVYKLRPKILGRITSISCKTRACVTAFHS